MNNIPIGTVQTMTVLRHIDTGYVLEKNNEQALLHHNETEKGLIRGEEVCVFLYSDKSGRSVASTKLPHVQMGNYDWAKVMDVVPGLGVFVDIGTAKDMLVSLDDLPVFEDVWPNKGDQLLVTLGQDKKGRLLAIPATEDVIFSRMEWAPENIYNQPTSGRIYKTSSEGSAFITEEDYRGFIHHTERKTEPRLGELISGRVIEVKEDGTINASLRPYKKQSRIEDADAILAYLEESEGVIALTDKSDPEDIRGTFGISKAAFKRALGKLMKDGKVEQKDGNTYLKDAKG